MRFVVQLGCGACLSAFRTTLEGRPCPDGRPQVHFPVAGLIQQWGAAHHEPGIIVLGPTPEET